MEKYILSSQKIGFVYRMNSSFRFSIKYPQTLKLSLLNLSGQGRYILAHAPFNSGEHEVSLPKSLSMGIYFLKFEGEDFAEVMKMMVVR